MSDTRPAWDGSDPVVPAGLAEGLRGAYGRAGPVPEAVDAAVLAAAAGRAAAIRRRRSAARVLARLSAVGAVAAAVAVAAVVWPRLGGEGGTDWGPAEVALAPGGVEEHRPPRAAVGGTGGGGTARVADRDVNGDGTVDILDALAVARAAGMSEQERRIRAIPGPLASWDFNRDGTVDRRDADEVAAAAVRLTPAGRG